MKSVEQQILDRIHVEKDGWAFSQADFAHLARREAVDQALSRLQRRGHLRRVVRGVYDLPRVSPFLGHILGPDPDAVAAALARKFGWRIQPSGVTALNRLGLSTQVPGRHVYLSDGPSRRFLLGNVELAFRHTALKEAGFAHPESALLVQALKALGEDHVTPDVEASLRRWLPVQLRATILQDTGTATGWVRKVLRRALQEDSDGAGGHVA